MKRLSFSFILIASFIILASGCRKSEVPIPDGMMKDIDGNLYRTVKIGRQVWMAENLRVTKYRNGTSIPQYLTDFEWVNSYTGLCCDYDNISDSTRGKLYNWFALETYNGHNIAPEGWHIPTVAEWQELIDSSGAALNSAGMLKDTSLWMPKLQYADSLFRGFNIVPGGYRYHSFYSKGYEAWFWMSAGPGGDTYQSEAITFYGNDNYRVSVQYGTLGFSVRCIKNY